MSNTELTKYYMGLQKTQYYNPLSVVSAQDIIPTLDRYFNGQWTWELADEKILKDDGLLTTVTVYTPGQVYTGRSYTNVSKSYDENHLFAIFNACQTLMAKPTEQKTAQTEPVASKPMQSNPNPVSQQMTPDQIMSAINQQNNQAQPQQQIRNLEELNNLKDEHGNPVEEIPFDAMSTLCSNESQHAMGMLPDYDVPQDRLKGFTQHQIDRLNQFKKDFDILNNQMFDNYVNTWDKNLTSKSQITPANVESFLAWAENLGKMGC